MHPMYIILLTLFSVAHAMEKPRAKRKLDYELGTSTTTSELKDPRDILAYLRSLDKGAQAPLEQDTKLTHESAEDLYSIAQIKYNEQNFKEALGAFIKVALQTENPSASAGALCFIGQICYKGQGMAPAYDIAYVLFKKVSEQSVNKWAWAGALYYIGLMYFSGHHVRKNLPHAGTLFEEVVNQDINKEAKIFSSYYVAACYHAAKRIDEALLWYDKACNQTLCEWTRAAALYDRGRIFYLKKKDYAAAAADFEQASHQTANLRVQGGAWCFRGQLFLHGHGVDQSDEEALSCFEKAARQTHNKTAQECSELYLKQLLQKRK